MRGLQLVCSARDCCRRLRGYVTLCRVYVSLCHVWRTNLIINAFLHSVCVRLSTLWPQQSISWRLLHLLVLPLNFQSFSSTSFFIDENFFCNCFDIALLHHGLPQRRQGHTRATTSAIWCLINCQRFVLRSSLFQRQLTRGAYS